MDQSSFITIVNNITEGITYNGKKERGQGVPLPKPSLIHNFPMRFSINNDRRKTVPNSPLHLFSKPLSLRIASRKV